ncbi:core-2/I-Branching enzyme [Streptomyces puniciscabiei]|uniref:Peptide O-xylosyltransferase n=1 Tax=Streptomyces puniciscabiei TaxID=164348 RepID=A0A542UIP8_9ACTN|nr:beta-1,6-N-acetylglucosaminyltransferase [Streptomyces puniciscabiei]TQK98944.1 core-2/I-Branching enzyme [Streptomyces puniciscabiei]
MPVFAVLAHTEPALFARLVERLAPYPVVVHVDARSRGADFEGVPRTTHVRDRVAVRWGGFSVVRATLALYRTALEVARPSEHIVLLSGQCYPARPVGEFAEYLASAPFRQHCRAAGVLDDKETAGRVLKRWCLDAVPTGPGPTYLPRALLRRAISELTPRRRPSVFGDIEPVAGSQWTALTADCVADLLGKAEDPRWENLFRTTHAPDEMFFHTLVWNSGWRDEVEDPVLRPRAGRVTADFTNFHYLERQLRGTRALADLPAIEASRMYFVRKVASPQSAELLDALDSRT